MHCFVRVAKPGRFGKHFHEKAAIASLKRQNCPWRIAWRCERPCRMLAARGSLKENCMRKLIIGNWKMNGASASMQEAQAMAQGLALMPPQKVMAVICPPATLIAGFASMLEGSALALGAQDCHQKPSGAHTGDLSAAMLVDVGARYILVGHSERRTDHGETDALVSAKATSAIGAGAIAVICVGETEAERDAGQTIAVVERQMLHSIPETASASHVVIAYEPVWAIGTGRTPTTADVAAVHLAIRSALHRRFAEAAPAVPILYGGSVKPSNAAELLHVANVDGALVGGASLKAVDFLGIIGAA
jgi:triosephosphate isomerase (TIM)